MVWLKLNLQSNLLSNLLKGGIVDLNVKKFSGENVGKLSMSDAVFDRAYNQSLIHQVVTATQAGIRQGTKANKSRSEVRGGGAKPWRQKGTGRARAGTNNSPLWRSGGVTFAAKPRSYAQKVNKKMYAVAMKSILSELVRTDRLIVLDEIDLPEPKTKLLADKMKHIGIDDALIVVSNEGLTENLYLASRNIKNVAVCDVDMLDPVGLIAFKNIIATQDALTQIEEQLS